MTSVTQAPLDATVVILRNKATENEVILLGKLCVISREVWERSRCLTRREGRSSASVTINCGGGGVQQRWSRSRGCGREGGAGREGDGG